MSGKHEKLAERLAGILIELNSSGYVDVNQLAEKFDVGVRTVQKDLNQRLAFLQWEKCGPKIYSIQQSQLGVFKKEDIDRFARFASVQDLFPKLDREFYQHTLTESIKVKGLQYEKIAKRQKEFQQIQQAIEKHQVIEFTYFKQQGSETSHRTLEPYVLLNKNGVWYLIGLENGKQKTFLFSQIVTITTLNKTFKPNPEFIQEIKNNDSISYGNQLNEIIIKVSEEVAHYFQRRNLLPNQEIIRKLDSGELLISCKNINEMEIIPLVQYWIPHLVIISPLNLQEKIINKIKNYIGNQITQ